MIYKPFLPIVNSFLDFRLQKIMIYHNYQYGLSSDRQVPLIIVSWKKFITCTYLRLNERKKKIVRSHGYLGFISILIKLARASRANLWFKSLPVHFNWVKFNWIKLRDDLKPGNKHTWLRWFFLLVVDTFMQFFIKD